MTTKRDNATWAIQKASFAILFSLLMTAARGSAQVPPMQARAPAPAITGDHRDFLFLASDRPVLLRLHIHASGRPYHEPWTDYMKKLFAYLDVNNDSLLDAKELKRMPPSQFLDYHFQGVLGIGTNPPPLKDVDADKDGKVSFAEMAGYYRQNGFDSLRVNFNSTKAATDTVTRTFFRELDSDRDGKLSPQEAARLSTALGRYDQDEDEMLTPAELSLGLSDPGPYRPLTLGGTTPPAGAEWLEVVPGTGPTGPKSLAAKLVERYDQNKDGKLSRQEIGLDEAAFAALDADHDGRLNAAELVGFFQRPADVELLLRTGKMLPALTSFDGLNSLVAEGIGWLGIARVQLRRSKAASPARAAPGMYDGQTLLMPFGDAVIEMSASDQEQPFFLANFYQQQFDSMAGKKGFVDRKSAQQDFLFNQIFDLLDRDGDGKLYRKEVDAFVNLQKVGAGCRTALQITDAGRSLFACLDADRDNRLSLRELRHGWSRLRPLAGKGGLAQKDIPARFHVTAGAGSRLITQGSITTNRSTPTRAPLWFRKMDRNNDGDLSPREFLGSLEQFRRLDTDGDGLISVAEALRQGS